MEQIYTIPVNEAFEAALNGSESGCPFCRLYDKLETNELEITLGDAMMQPDIRMQTNASGFCDKHFEMLFSVGKRLPLALILESHLEHIHEILKPGMFPTKSAVETIKKISNLTESCHICSRIENNFSKMIETAALLWQNDSSFKEKTAAQDYFCLNHYGRFLSAAKERLSKKEFTEFYKVVSTKELEYIANLNDDVSKFCKKFDYRYANEPWDEAKNAPEKAVTFLCGDMHKKHDGPLKK